MHAQALRVENGASQFDAAPARSYIARSDGAPDAKEPKPRDAGSVTASEFSFLALGLILGVVSGAALVEFVRARPRSPHEVRVTVSHDAIPRRASTLADDAFISIGPEPARGGPADRRLIGTPMPAGTSERRTAVRYTPGSRALTPSMAGAVPIAAGRGVPMPGSIMEPALPLATPPPGRVSRPDVPLVGIPISSGDDPAIQALRDLAFGATSLSVAKSAPAAVAVLDRPQSQHPGSGAEPGAPSRATERCAEERRIAGERCELATLVRGRADVAADALRTAQRAYDGHEADAVAASWRADPRAVHEAKDSAQGGFRAAVTAARTPEQLEAAARDWLTEINRINTEAREATIVAARERVAATAIGETLERLGLEADAARIGAETADAACLAARVAVADCDEQVDTDRGSFLIPPLAVAQSGMPRLDDDETLRLALDAGGAPRIFRLLQGDRGAMTSLVAALAGDDPEARRRWQLQLTNLVEAIVADAIEASALEFPEGHPFWGLFTRLQDRDVVSALSSLGYRFDGLGGWTDARHPSQRNLSLALGYAGLDPKRVRHWPTEDDIAALFQDVTVAADEYLATVAGDLTLAEMVGMLGRRADHLAEIWNHWGRLRPLLLDEG
jgi:hypothetical protein